MRVRVVQTVTVDDAYRRAINLFYGQPGLATRADVAAWIRAYGTSMDDDLMRSLEDAEVEA
jgi:hypothetical protein